MKSYQGIVIKKTLEHWRPLLKEWISLMEKYCSEIWDDPIYCHEERANVSLLASAAWRIDWLAVQELWVERLSGGSTFCDLWLRPNSTKAGEYIEAKIKYNVDTTIQYFLDADGQIKNIKPNEKESKIISLYFIVPSIQKQSDIDKEIEVNINTALKVKCDALAWCFPMKTRQIECTGDKVNINPGIFLFAKMVE